MSVYARRAEAARPLVDHGATACPTPATVAERSDVVFIMVTGTSDVEQVVLGDDGVIQGARRDALVVDMSTIDPTATRSLGHVHESPRHAGCDRDEEQQRNPPPRNTAAANSLGVGRSRGECERLALGEPHAGIDCPSRAFENRAQVSLAQLEKRPNRRGHHQHENRPRHTE